MYSFRMQGSHFVSAVADLFSFHSLSLMLFQTAGTTEANNFMRGGTCSATTTPTSSWARSARSLSGWTRAGRSSWSPAARSAVGKFGGSTRADSLSRGELPP